MITHEDIWHAIDELAIVRSVSPSRLAIVCGLNSTTFNKSKRVVADGRGRFPSFATVAKVLNTENMSMTEFGAICDKYVNQRMKNK